MSVLIETTVGDLVIDLDVDRAPRACTNFLKLCGLKHYNYNLIFNVHRHAFFETGDPAYPDTQNSLNRSAWSFADDTSALHARNFFHPEISRDSSFLRGTVALTCDGSRLAGSQVVVCLGVCRSFVGVHAVIGRVAEDVGDVLGKVERAMCDDDRRPLHDIRILHTIILHDPFPQADIPTRNLSPPPTPAQLAHARHPTDHTLEPAEDEDSRRVKEAQVSALALETLGDLPFAGARPEENVLFVGGLNGATRSDDLGLIFGRFGQVRSCEVVRDRVTRDSLRYAFVEFHRSQDAEAAYSQMQGVLIDDRHIHVDFSQSVRKQQRAARSPHRSGRDRAAHRDYDDDDDDGYREKRAYKRSTRDSRPRSRSRSPGRHRRHRHQDDEYEDEYRSSREHKRRDHSSRHGSGSGECGRRHRGGHDEDDYESRREYSRRDRDGRRRSESRSRERHRRHRDRYDDNDKDKVKYGR
ncbi:Peptidyl-prolyl cis-trans isomerase-like 4 [Savitreella phatthalungensis]